MEVIRRKDADVVFTRLQSLYHLWDDGATVSAGSFSFREAHCFVLGAGVFSKDEAVLDANEVGGLLPWHGMAFIALTLSHRHNTDTSTPH
jgi:hypothetical protein